MKAAADRETDRGAGREDAAASRTLAEYATGLVELGLDPQHRSDATVCFADGGLRGSEAEPEDAGHVAGIRPRAGGVANGQEPTLSRLAAIGARRNHRR